MAKKKKEAVSPFVPAEEQPYKVPENWCWVSLGSFIDYATDYVANGSFASLKANVHLYKDENYALMVKTADFANDFSKSLTYTDKQGYDFLEKSVLYGGELILSNIGSIGKVFRVPFFNRPMTLASNSIMIKCRQEYDYDWLYYFFLSPIGYEELLSITTGTAVLKFNKTDLKTIPLPVPPLPEQQRIVDRIESLFAKLDEAKEKAQSVVDSFELRKSAILHKAFTGELTVQWRKEHGVGMESWKTKTIGMCCNLITKGASPKWQGIDYTDDKTQTLFITSENVREGYLDMTKEKYLDNKINDIQKRSVLQEGDVLLNIVGASIGRSAIFNLSVLANTNQAVCIIRLKPTISSEFICYYLNSAEAQQYYSGNKVETARANISLSNISNMPITTPELSEQLAVVETIDKLISKEQQAKETAEAVLDQVDTMKKAILSRAFRGELGTNDLTEEWSGELLEQIE